MQIAEWDSVSIKKVDEMCGPGTSALNLRLASVRNYVEFNPIVGCTADGCKTIHDPLIEFPYGVQRLI